jgi:glycosyltransferase involved in cell wall biosynthesis
MRALFIGSYPNPVEPYRSVFFRELICQMAEMGVECTVISTVSVTKYRQNIKMIPEFTEEVLPSGRKISVYYPRCVSFSAKKFGPLNTYPLTIGAHMDAVMRQMKKLGGQFDFVYGHFFLDGGLAAAKVGRTYGIPAYIAYGECSYETEVSGRYRDLRPEDLQGVHGIISVSSKNSRDIQARPCAKDIPVFIALNSVNKSVFYPKDKQKCREKFGLPQNDFILGFVGYFIERKGCNRVMAACEGLEGVKLAFAGKGPLEPKGENVVFCRGLRHEDVADFLGAVDVFVLPTLHEGCCNAVIEAMSCGKPVISSDLPFNHDVLHEGNSILVDPNSVPQIREAIIALRDDVSRRQVLADRALQDARALSIDHRAENILRFIQSTI